MKKIAIVTGGSGGLGKEFVRILVETDLDEIWVVARNEEKLRLIKEEFGRKIVYISKDLSQKEDIYSFATLLIDCNVRYLINNAGVGRMGGHSDFSLDEIGATIDLNCTSMAILCDICIPYMVKGARILNISSQSSFQPVPYLNLYAATKAFVTSYSRALHVELKNRQITVTAVCPGWVETDLLKYEVNHQKVKFPALVSPNKVAMKALRDANKGKDMSVYKVYVKFMRVSAKVLPHKLVMKKWMHDIRKYI